MNEVGGWGESSCWKVLVNDFVQLVDQCYIMQVGG